MYILTNNRKMYVLYTYYKYNFITIIIIFFFVLCIYFTSVPRTLCDFFFRLCKIFLSEISLRSKNYKRAHCCLADLYLVFISTFNVYAFTVIVNITAFQNTDNQTLLRIGFCSQRSFVVQT